MPGDSRIVGRQASQDRARLEFIRASRARARPAARSAVTSCQARRLEDKLSETRGGQGFPADEVVETHPPAKHA